MSHEICPIVSNDVTTLVPIFVDLQKEWGNSANEDTLEMY